MSNISKIKVNGTEYPIIGVPTGGANGQVLTKDGSTAYAVKWADASGSSYVLPAANATTRGGIKVGEHLTVTNDDVLGVIVESTLNASSTNPMSSSVIVTALNSKADTSALTTHINNTTSHITSTERTTWNSKQDALPSVIADRYLHTTENGTLEWATVTSGSTALYNLTDVSVAGRQNGQVLVYSTADNLNKWISRAITITDVANLQSTLDGKAASEHTHPIANIVNLQSELNGKAASSHTHTESEINNLSEDLAAKATTTALAATNSNLTAHIGDGTIHVTAANKAAWDAKQSALPLSTPNTYLHTNSSNELEWVASGGGSGVTYTFTTPLSKDANNNVSITAATATEVEEEGIIVVSGTDGYLTKEDKNKLNHLDLGSGDTGYYYALTYNTEYGLWKTTIFSGEQAGTKFNNTTTSIQSINNYSTPGFSSFLIGPTNYCYGEYSAVIGGWMTNVFGNYSTSIVSTDSNVLGMYSVDIAGNGNTITNGACLKSKYNNINIGSALLGDNNTINKGIVLAGNYNNITGKSKHDIIIGGNNNTINNEYDDNNIIIGGSNNIIKTYAANSVLLASKYGSTNQRGVIANQYNPKKFTDRMRFHTGFKGVRPVWSTMYNRTATPLLENVHTAIINLQVIAFGSYDWSDSTTLSSGSESDNFILETSTVLIRNGAVYQQQSESLKDDNKVTPVFKCFIEDGDLHIRVYTDYWSTQYLGAPNTYESDSMSAYTAITRNVHAPDIDWIDCGVWYTMYSLSDESDSSSSSSN